MAQKGKTTGGFNVVGESLQLTSSREDIKGEEEGGSNVMSKPTSSAGVAVAWSSQPSSPKDFVMVDQVMAVNRSLVQQIDALRLRVQVDTRHYDASRSALERESDEKLKQKDAKIQELKGELRSKESAVKGLTDENQKKRSEIQSLQHTINALKDDVDASKTYVDDIQLNLNILQEEKEKLETGAAYREKEELIRRLTQEVCDMRNNLSKLERELAKAKEVISTQGSNLRLLDHDKHNTHIKFRDELARATQTMRHEVERMREVMRGQWEEMRVLRQQNEGMSTDIKQIKDLLLGETTNNNNTASTEHQGPMYNMGALKPSLPALSKSSRRNVPVKKKPLG